MGVIKRGILGGVSGSIGSVVGTSWKGIAVLKSKPLSVANPRTVQQVTQRDKMSLVVALSKAILGTVIKPLWDRFAQKMSGYNMFVSTNIDQMNPDNAPYFEPANLKTSIGKLLPTTCTIPTISDGSTSVIITYDDFSTGNQSDNDVAYAVAILDDVEVAVGASGALRSEGSLTIVFDREVTTGQIVYIYLSFRSPDGRSVSNSTFQQKTVTA